MPRTIAAVFAHPDDETFATGGTLAKYASEGARIVLYCATNGDAGKTSGIPVSSREELGALRREELRAACEILGVTPTWFGDHADGALAQVDPDTALGEIVAFLRQSRPDVVLTFGPEGAPTQHRDHRAICRLATAAYHLAGTSAFGAQHLNGLLPPRAKRLCYVTWPVEIEQIYHAQGQPIDIRVDVRAWLDRKREAFRAHATQRQHEEAFEKGVVTDDECYFVASGVPAPSGASDLFAGLGDD